MIFLVISKCICGYLIARNLVWACVNFIKLAVSKRKKNVILFDAEVLTTVDEKLMLKSEITKIFHMPKST